MSTLLPTAPSPRRLVRYVASVALAGLIVVAAGLPASAQDGPDIIPVLASSELAAGPNRFLFSITDRAGAPIAAPDVAVQLRFYDDDTDPEAVVFESPARFLWAIEDVRGLYAADADFPSAGRWGTRFDVTFPDGHSETVRVDYDVQEITSTPAIGSAGPAVDSPTAADVSGDVSQISSDPKPVERFYELSIADAMAAGAPAVVAFVTPGFCQSATCGPTLDKVKEVATGHPDVNVVHVEPYVMAVQEGGLQPVLSAEGYLQAAPWTEAWGLRTEPFVAVVDAAGNVQAKFEGAITAEELDAALDALS